MRGARPLAKAQEAPCVRPSCWLLRQGHVSMYVQMCMSSFARLIDWSVDGLIGLVLFFFDRQSIANVKSQCLCLRHSPRSRECARRKSALPACPLADMTHAHSCLNPKAQPASPPHAEARPLGASQRLGHAVPLGALRRAAGAAQEAQASPGAQPPDDAADVDDETGRPAGELPGFPVVFTTHRACDPSSASIALFAMGLR